MKTNNDTNILVNTSINDFFSDVLRVIDHRPELTGFVLQTMVNQRIAARKRSFYEQKGIQVPAYMIFSVTNRCNLHCKGCYSRAQQRPVEKEMGLDKLRSVITEARDLGISFIFLAGGEPLTRPHILNITRDFPEIIFPLFTNGLLITDQTISTLREQKNVVPIISIEGRETDTDNRRGSGVSQHLQGTIEKIKQAKGFFGLSFTVTRDNYPTLTDKAFITRLIDSGCQLFFFVEYVPVNETTQDLVVTDEQRASLALTLSTFREDFPGLFVSFPGDEQYFGGCLSAAQGFVHVSADGALEPCPFAPYSDANLMDKSLKEALQSELLAKLRQNRSELTETRSGCALWEKREWVKSLV